MIDIYFFGSFDFDPDPDSNSDTSSFIIHE